MDQKDVTELNTHNLFKNKFEYLSSPAVQNTQAFSPVSQLCGTRMKAADLKCRAGSWQAKSKKP